MMAKIIAAVTAAVTALFAGTAPLTVINDLLTAIFGTVAEEEGITTYPIA